MASLDRLRSPNSWLEPPRFFALDRARSASCDARLAMHVVLLDSLRNEIRLVPVDGLTHGTHGTRRCVFALLAHHVPLCPGYLELPEYRKAAVTTSN